MIATLDTPSALLRVNLTSNPVRECCLTIWSRSPAFLPPTQPLLTPYSLKKGGTRFRSKSTPTHTLTRLMVSVNPGRTQPKKPGFSFSSSISNDAITLRNRVFVSMTISNSREFLDRECQFRGNE